MTALDESAGDVTAAEFRQAMGHFPTGVTVVTSIGADGEPQLRLGAQLPRTTHTEILGTCSVS